MKPPRAALTGTLTMTAVAGLLLAVTGAVIPATPSEFGDMVPIPAGMVVLGDDSAHAMMGPAVYKTPAYNIDRFEVTNAQYAVFIKATGHAPAAFADDAAFNQADQPVTGVSWQDAVDYCTWSGKRLPSEVEWEKAARGVNGQIYPWGSVFDPAKAHLSGEAPVPVSAFSDDTSPFGVRGLAGNVSEWVADTDQARAGVCGKGHHDHGGQKTAGKSDASVPTETCAYLKGNSWSGRPHMTKLSNRMWDYASSVAEFVGFRCARSAG